ncbi:MAG: c-type cytochrome [Magnetospiraceae bacterium]
MRRASRHAAVMLMGLAGMLGGSVPTRGEEPLPGPVAGRQQAMKMMKQSMATIGAVAVRSQKGDLEDLAMPAKMLVMATGRIAHTFPDGVAHPKSKASDKIWVERATFDHLAADAARAAQALSDTIAAQDGTNLALRFGTLAEACKSCHQRYRLSDQ